MPNLSFREWSFAHRLAGVVMAAIALFTFPGPVIAVAGKVVREADVPLMTVDGPLYIVRQPRTGRVSVHLIFGYSAPPHEMHYVEHLVWLNVTGATGDRRDSNAWTTRHAVGYWLSGSSGELAEMLHTLAGVFAPIRLSERFAAQERDIILRERELRMAMHPDLRIAWKMETFLYAGTPLAVPVIGTPEEIRNLDIRNARTLHAATHRPERASLVIVGDVTPEMVHLAMTRAGFPDLGKAVRNGLPRLHLKRPVERLFRFRESNLRLVWRRAVTLSKPVQYDLLEARCALLREILRSNLPGGLAGPLLYDGMLVRNFDIRIRAVDERHVELRFDAAPDGKVSLRQLRGAFEKRLAETAATGIPQRTFERVRKRFDAYWPDWGNRRETSEWLGRYVLRRASALRRPMKVAELRRLRRNLAGAALDDLLKELAAPGRTAIAHVEPGGNPDDPNPHSAACLYGSHCRKRGGSSDRQP